MKRTWSVILLVVSMLTTVGFTSVETSYWSEMKQIYEWNAMEGESETELDIAIPDIDVNYQYKIYANTQSNLKDLSSYSEIKVEDVQGILNIPTIKMYTYGSDFYINKEAVMSILSALNMAEGVEIKEEYIMIESGKDDVKVDINTLNDIMKFVENIELGIDLGMEKEGNTYTLTLESDKLIDLLDAYVKYSIENIDKFPNSLMQGQEIILTEAEKQETLKAYSTFADEYKDMAKLFITGSKYNMQSTFKKDKYSGDTQLAIKTPLGQLNMNSVSTTSKLEASNFKLPTSVKKLTPEELEKLVGVAIPTAAINEEVKAVVKLDGSCLKKSKDGFEAGQISLKLQNGKTYITVADANKLLDIKLENMEDPFYIRELEDYGFSIKWNEEDEAIEIY